MNKRIAPTLVVLVLVLLILVQAGVIIFVAFTEGLGIFWTLLILLVPLAIAAALFGVYRERMKEISEEEKDDLSRY